MSGVRGRLKVHITLRASRTEISGWRGDTLQARVTTPPVDGGANEALVRLIAGALGIAPSRVAIVSGAASREKLVAVDGFSGEALLQAFARASGGVSRRSTARGRSRTAPGSRSSA